MENGSRIVSDAVLGEDLKFLTIGGTVYSVKPPSIEVILRAIRHLSQVRLDGTNYNKINIVSEYPRNTEHIVRGIAVLIHGKDGWKTRRLSKQLMKGTYEELFTAFQEIVKMMGGDSFFALAQSARNLNRMAASPK